MKTTTQNTMNRFPQTMPERKGSFLVLVDDEFEVGDYYPSEGWIVNGYPNGFQTDNVSHWAELPQKPVMKTAMSVS